MNIRHLGDAYDHWKGSVISILSSRNKIGPNLVVVPMLTDPQLWKARDLRTYRRLLNPLNLCGVNIILCHINDNETFTNSQTRRKKYFSISNKYDKYDIFLDPDIGIAPPSGSKKGHITVGNIRNLLDGNRVMMVYQHSTHSRDRFPNIGSMLRGVSYYSFKCGQVAMFFISRSKKQIEAIKKTLIYYQKQA